MYNVSIIIPCYVKTPEALGWLDECLTSAEAQGCEICVCDDASPIDVTGIITRHNVHAFVRNEVNRGVAYTRNAAIYMATRELILPLDSDDKLAPGAVKDLLEYWDGYTPVYPDVTKFGDGIPDEPYPLLEFQCQYLDDFVGFTSVNVLHTKAQWQTLGGYDPTIEYYEDGEYNARLMGTYCARRCPKLLVWYRQHPYQRTKHYGSAGEYARQLLSKIRRYDRMCKSCQKRRSDPNYETMVTQQRSQERTNVQAGNQNVNLPLEFQGKILALYTGGRGMGTHYYKGVKTKHPYRVNYGDYVYADPADVCEVGQNWSYLKRVTVAQQPQPQPVAAVTAPPAPQPPVTVQQIAATETKVPEIPEVVENASGTESPEMPLDISSMSAKDITSLELTQEQAAMLLQLEKDGLNRKKVIAWLEARVN